MDNQWVDFKAIKTAVSMTMVLEHYGVGGFKKTGDELRGPCPFHGGGAASKQFCVNVSKNAFKCFAKMCNARGNVLDFVAAKENCSIKDAAVKLRDWFKVGETEVPSTEELAITDTVAEARVLPGVYQHFKGNTYLVIGVAVHSESGEELVVYRPLYGTYRLTVRPKAMFLETIECDDYIGPRFSLVQAVDT